jgi:hypothetical protein
MTDQNWRLSDFQPLGGRSMNSSSMQVSSGDTLRIVVERMALTKAWIEQL